MHLLGLATTFAMHSPPADQPAHCTCGSDLCLTICRHVIAAESRKLSTPGRSCIRCAACGVCCIREEVCAGCGCSAHMPQYCPRAAAVSMQVPAQNIRRHADSITLICGARRHHRLPRETAIIVAGGDINYSTSHRQPWYKSRLPPCDPTAQGLECSVKQSVFITRSTSLLIDFCTV